LGDTERVVAQRYGFRNLSHSLEFFGRCHECSQGEGVATPPNAGAPR
jgi:Fe2+ or Zn2+ uptake regulation protein